MRRLKPLEIERGERAAFTAHHLHHALCSGLGRFVLGGFGMGAAKRRRAVHIVIFAAAMSIALYIITDIEFPRQGLITVAYFDRFFKQF